MAGKVKPLVGVRFGRLVVLSFSHMVGEYSFWNCLCDCGNTSTVRRHKLVQQHTRSCGCLQAEKRAAGNKTHGLSKRPEYSGWSQMIQRCTQPTNKRWESYGGRGITVCERWMSFENFYSDMGERPPNTTLDRIDNSKGYSPDNCRWATPFEQQRNMRSNTIVFAFGKNMCIAEWSEEADIPATVISMRIHRLGWSAERAVSEPVH